MCVRTIWEGESPPPNNKKRMISLSYIFVTPKSTFASHGFIMAPSTFLIVGTSLLVFQVPQTLCLIINKSNSRVVERRRVVCNAKGRPKENVARRRPRNCDDVLWIERDLNRESGYFPILGSDESGRGCVAGPVIAATCAIIQDFESYEPIPGVRDSKELTPEQRETIYEQVMAQKEVYVWSVAERSNTQIDDTNILLATMECFKESIESVVAALPDPEHSYSIVDGKKGPKLSIDVPSRPWVQGDKEVYSVSLASILAKVTRDRMSAGWHQCYPEYGFNVHRGYATPAHVEAIHRHGPCPLHRLSFKTLKGR
jgi:ribonuclease HII